MHGRPRAAGQVCAGPRRRRCPCTTGNPCTLLLVVGDVDDPAHSVVQPLRPQMFTRPTVGTCQRGQPHLPLHPQEEAPSEVCSKARLHGVKQLLWLQYTWICFLFSFHCHHYRCIFWYFILSSLSPVLAYCFIFNFFSLSL